MRFIELIIERNEHASISVDEEEVTTDYEKKLKDSYKGKAKSYKAQVTKTAGRYNVEIVDDFSNYSGRSY